MGLLSRFAQRGQNIGNAIQGGADALQASAQGQMNPLQAGLKLAGTGLQTAGNIAGGVGDIVGEAVSPFIKPVISGIANIPQVQQFAQSKPVSAGLDAVNGFTNALGQQYNVLKQNHPDAVNNVEAGGNILSVLLANQAAQKANNAIKDAAGNNPERGSIGDLYKKEPTAAQLHQDIMEARAYEEKLLQNDRFVKDSFENPDLMPKTVNTTDYPPDSVGYGKFLPKDNPQNLPAPSTPSPVSSAAMNNVTRHFTSAEQIVNANPETSVPQLLMHVKNNIIDAAKRMGESSIANTVMKINPNDFPNLGDFKSAIMDKLNSLPLGMDSPKKIKTQFASLSNGIRALGLATPLLSDFIRGFNKADPKSLVAVPYVASIISDETNTIRDTGQPAVHTYDQNPLWSVQLPTTADGRKPIWIWKSEYVEFPNQDERTSIDKTFNLINPGAITGANSISMFKATSDREFELWMNGQFVCKSKAPGFTPENETFCDLGQYQRPGQNNLHMNIFNRAYPIAGTGTPQNNPAGIQYRVDIMDENNLGTCPVGQYWNGTSCISTACPAGQHFNYDSGTCEADPTGGSTPTPTPTPGPCPAKTVADPRDSSKTITIRGYRGSDGKCHYLPMFREF